MLYFCMGISVPITWELILDLASQKSISISAIFGRDFLERGLTDRVLLLVSVWVPNLVTICTVIPLRLVKAIPIITQLRFLTMNCISGLYLSQIGGRTFNTIPFVCILLCGYVNFLSKALSAFSTLPVYQTISTVAVIIAILPCLYV